MFRDYGKVLTTKQFYTGKNWHIHANPRLHVEAILEGLQAEEASHALEDVLKIRASAYPATRGSNYDKLMKKEFWNAVRFKFISSGG